MTTNALARAVFVPVPPPRLTLLAALTMLTVAACATTSIGVPSRHAAPFEAGAETAAPVPVTATGAATIAEAEAAIAHGRPLDAVARYQQAALAASAAQAAAYRLRAAEAANLANDPVRADGILDQIPAMPLDAAMQSRYRLLRAQTALARNDPARALRLLPVGDPGGEPAVAAAELQARATALTRSGDLVAATQSLVLRERYLATPREIADNREALWTILRTSTLDPVSLNRAATAPTVTRGWIELAALARRSAPLADYETWRQRYPAHPGEERLASLFVLSTNLAAGAPAGNGGINLNAGTPAAASPPSPAAPLAAGTGAPALLLPASGTLQPLADAVRAGFASAAAKAGLGEARSYDSQPGAAAAYQQAVGDGAGLAVGPLRKEDATALAQASLTVPALALNYLDPGRAAPAGLYQFGLAPEDEARAAAEDAYARGLARALVLVPATDWGRRVQTAFDQRLRELGGKVQDSATYNGDPGSWADPVKRLLRYVPIEDKKKAAEARAKAQPGIDPQRRNDFDYVFLAGRAAQARVLWPLLRYYHADRTPIYATAAIYETDGDSDLSGIRFCDAPWVLDNGGPWAALGNEAHGGGRSFDNARLYALGHDAALLAGRIAQNRLHAGDELPGATGTLHVEPTGAVRRILSCAQMTNTVPFPLAVPGSP